jgi:hypothetical protein
MSEYILTHKHQTHNHAASGWRIHCGVEDIELSTNKQNSLSQTIRAPCSAPPEGVGRGKHAVGVCDDGAGARDGDDEGTGGAGGGGGGQADRTAEVGSSFLLRADGAARVAGRAEEPAEVGSESRSFTFTSSVGLLLSLI